MRRSAARRFATTVALSLLPLVVLLVLLEAILWAAGLGDPEELLSLTRGFDDRARYLVPDDGPSGSWRTQIFAVDAPECEEIHIPPKGSRLRVLMFGGSNTQGFPDEYVQDALNAAAPDPGFEVINLGRQGYGSERVLILLRQAMVLEPDIVFIYVGHNEFVERGFAYELAQQWSRPWIARTVERLSRLRVLNVLVPLFEPAGAGDGAGKAPEARQSRGADFHDMSYDQTLVFYDVYRRNLQAMCDTAQAHGAGVMISTVIGNEFFPPLAFSHAPTTSPEVIEHCRTLRVRAEARFPERLRKGLFQTGPDDPPIHLRPTDWGESLTEEQLAERRVRGAAEAPPLLRSLPAPFAGGPLWTDPALWTPQVGELLATMAAVCERRLSDSERQDLEAAATLYEKALKLVPDQPYTLFELGLCVYLLGTDDARADRLLRDACRYDRAPTRGNDVTNGIVRQLAAERPELAFVDAEAFARACFPSGLIGYELMMDNCHLHAGALQPLMDQFVPALRELGARRAAGQRAAAPTAPR